MFHVGYRLLDSFVGAGLIFLIFGQSSRSMMLYMGVSRLVFSFQGGGAIFKSSGKVQQNQALQISKQEISPERRCSERGGISAPTCSTSADANVVVIMPVVLLRQQQSCAGAATEVCVIRAEAGASAGGSGGRLTPRLCNFLF